MAKNNPLRAQCMQLYVVEGKSINEIAELTGKALSNLYKWKKQDKWDDKCITGSVELSVTLEQKLLAKIKEFTDNDTLINNADALSKLQKIVDRLRPEKVLLSSMYAFLKAITSFIMKTRDQVLIDKWTLILPDISNHLRELFTKD